MMQFCDIHIHVDGKAVQRDIIREMDNIGMEKAVLLSPHTHESNEDEIESINIVSDLCSDSSDRLIPFAWIEPTLSDAKDHVEYAVSEKSVRGIKMIPDHWYPYEERLFPVYEKIEEMKVPVLFHSGILYANGDSSRFCRPCFFEVMLHFPGIKFALAHISWPWTDECIATFGRMRAAAGDSRKNQMYIDTTRGTPDCYRKDALDKALQFAGAQRILFGSDCFVPGPLSRSLEHIEKDRTILIDELGYSEKEFFMIVSGNLTDFLAPFERDASS